MDYEFSTTTFVHLATAAQVIGLLVTRQLILRLMVLTGSALFVVYYYTHLGQPQWDAIVGSSLIGLANLVGLMVLLYSRIPIGMRGENRLLFEAIGGLEPGQFRKLMRVGRMVQSPEPVVLTKEGEVPDQLFFVLKGRPLIEKDDYAFRIADRCFVGEVAFKLGCLASATATLPEGGMYVTWERTRLEALLARKPTLQQAFDALIARDMANKVALSAPIRCNDTVVPLNPFGFRPAV